MRTTTKKEITLKNGAVIPEGTNGLITWEGIIPVFTAMQTDVKLHPCRLHKYFNDFEAPPTVAQLGNMVCDGIVTTPTGMSTEPDGHDEYGAPSWLLILGLC